MKLYGRHKQTSRLETTMKFSQAQHACLFATDIVARGLDFLPLIGLFRLIVRKMLRHMCIELVVLRVLVEKEIFVDVITWKKYVKKIKDP